MLSKCANPACTTVFQYLRDGRLFQMETGAGSSQRVDKKTPRRIEYFWLCNRCAAELTLRYEPGAGVVTIPITLAQRAVAS